MSELKMGYVPLFGDLSESQQVAIWDRMVLEKRHIGEHLYRQGEPGERLYLVKSGWVRVISDQLGVLASSGPGSLLGDADVLLGHNHGTTTEAMGEVEALALGLEDLVDVVSEQPEIGLKLSAVYRASVIPLIRYLVERRLRPISGLDDLPDNVLVTMAGRLCVHYAQPGEALFSAGQAPTNLYIVDEGRVTAADASGLASEYGPGELVAERNVLLGRAHTQTARAATACRLWELSTKDLDRLSELYPDLRAALSRVLVSRLDAPDQSRAAAALRATPLFQSVPAEALNALAGRMAWQSAPAGARIFEPDAPAEAMYLVEGGAIELLDRRGEVQGRIQAGSYFGESGLTGGRANDLAAVARGNTTLWALSRVDFEAVAGRYPALRRAVEAQLTAEKDAGAEHFAERHLRRLSLFAGMTTEQLRDVAGYLRMEEYRPGQVLYQRGQPGEALYLIEQGRVSVQIRAPEGRVRVLAVMGPGEFVGETALLTGESHATDALAQTDVSAWALTRVDFETLLARYPVLAVNLSRTLSYRLRESNEQARAAVSSAAEVAPEPSVVAAPAAARAVARPAAGRPAAATAPRPAAAGAPASIGTGRGPLAWFGALTTGGKIRLVVIALLVLWLLAVAAPSLVISLLSNRSNAQEPSGRQAGSKSVVLVAMAAGDVQAAEEQATWTPWPTDTPIPSPTPTDTPVPTATSTPTNTPVPPTATPVPPTATSVPPTATRVPPTATPRPVAVEQPKPAVAAAAPLAQAAPVAQAAPAAPAPAARAAGPFQITELRRLTPCENKGLHNIFVKVVDGSGAPVDGVTIVQVPAGTTNVLDKTISGTKGPGLAEFAMWKNSSGTATHYDVYVTQDGTNPVGEVARDLNSGLDQDEMCSDGQGGNTKFHVSYRLVFRKNG